MTAWVVLRMAGPRTLPVVRSLVRAGIDVWTPVRKARRTLPRSRKYRDIEMAEMPTFAFAAEADLYRLRLIVADPASPHPAFTLLTHKGCYPRVSDAALQPLRDHEASLAERWAAFERNDRLSRKKGNARAYVMGQRVKLPDTAFEGLIGTVIENRRGQLVISFEHGGKVTVDSCYAEPIQLSSGKPEQGNAAQAA